MRVEYKTKIFQTELRLAREAVKEALQALGNLDPRGQKLKCEALLAREMKTMGDKNLEKIILKRLAPTGIPILSEEIGLVSGQKNTNLKWVVDPLDGTINFVRGVGSCGISVALCRNYKPIFGVIGEFPSNRIFWGGKSMGAFRSGQPIRVSCIKNQRKAVLCSGFPSRFEFKKNQLRKMDKWFTKAGKVRMLGSATVSLLRVAQGSAEVYAELSIMLWDVAAGLAIVEGAGGMYSLRKSRDQKGWDVRAGNNLVNSFK
ncbi:MAG: inositol monophosphatase [Chitinophagia bacterium]|nr:inositol monophosphatase [Chitinophagia bacterium]